MLVIETETGEEAEIAELEVQDLKEPVRMNIKTEVTIFLTLTATFLSLGGEDDLEAEKLWEEDNL